MLNNTSVVESEVKKNMSFLFYLQCGFVGLAILLFGFLILCLLHFLFCFYVNKLVFRSICNSTDDYDSFSTFFDYILSRIKNHNNCEKKKI